MADESEISLLRQEIESLKRQVTRLSVALGQSTAPYTLSHGVLPSMFVAQVDDDDNYVEMGVSGGAVVSRPGGRSGLLVSLGDGQQVVLGVVNFVGGVKTRSYVPLGGGGDGIKKMRWSESSHCIQVTTKDSPAEEDWRDEISFEAECS